MKIIEKQIQDLTAEIIDNDFMLYDLLCNTADFDLKKSYGKLLRTNEKLKSFLRKLRKLYNGGI